MAPNELLMSSHVFKVSKYDMAFLVFIVDPSENAPEFQAAF